MKKALAFNPILSFAAAILIFSLSTCKKDASVNTGLTGKWTGKQFSSDNSIIQQYEFKSNDSVEFYTYKIDTLSKKILGYTYRMIGTYKLDNATLTINNQTIFVNAAHTYGPVTLLVPNGSSGVTIYTVAIKQKSNQVVLSLYFNCPPYADCVPSPLIYYKQ